MEQATRNTATNISSTNEAVNPLGNLDEDLEDPPPNRFQLIVNPSNQVPTNDPSNFNFDSLFEQQSNRRYHDLPPSYNEVSI